MTAAEVYAVEHLDADVLAYTANMTRAEWLDVRRAGIGGSDAPAVAGLSKWSSPFAVWLDKAGLAPATDRANEAMTWGQLLEPVVRDEVGRRLGWRIDPVHATLRSRPYPFAIVNLDGLAWPDGPDGDPVVYEGKIASAYVGHEWEGDEVPDAYVVQVQHELMVTGLSRAIVGVLIGGNHLEIRHVERDDELIGHLVELERAFWEDHVVPGVQPPPDGSDACTTLIGDLYPAPDARSTVTIDEAEVDVIEGLLVAKAEAAAALKVAEAQEKAAKNALRARIGDATDLLAPDGRTTLATWRPQVKRTLDVGFDRAALTHAHPTIARMLTRENTIRVLRTPTKASR